MKFLKNQGITLIALIVTIIVLLILAGVSISVLAGDNGILQQATNASVQTDIESTKEAIKLELLSNFDEDSYSYTVSDIEAAVTTVVGENTLNTADMTATTAKGNTMDLSDLFESAVQSYAITETLTGVLASDENATSVNENGSTTLTYTTTNAWRLPSSVSVSGANYTWNQETGNLVLSNATDEVSITITADEYYGAKVTNYTVGNSDLYDVLDGESITWQIFYADDDYTYVIASDYVPYTAMPATSTNGYQLTKAGNSNNYQLNFSSDVLSEYSGSENITETKLQALNSKYYSYLTNNNTSSTTKGMQAVAYMMDTDIWSIYQDSTGNADFAIAGPTIELLFSSYNEKYGTNYQTRVQDISGYEISKDGGENWSTWYEEILNTDDNIYVIDDSSKAGNQWLSSTSAEDTTSLVCACSNGAIDYGGYNYSSIGFRPLIALKSDTQLELQSDGTYEIQ